MARGPGRDRGSRKHVLDLLEGNDFRERLQRVFNGTAVRLAESPLPQPIGRGGSKEWAEYDIETYLSRRPIEGWSSELPQCWWIKGRGNRPKWDLLCHARVFDEPGLLLAEAKAHEGELGWPGKRLSPSAKLASKDNHARIAGCVKQANDALDKLCDGVFGLDMHSHYQLGNRIAYAWKLAHLGLHVVLLYLGFTDDQYFHADYIRDDAHWQRVMGGYFQGVIPQQFPEKVHTLSSGGSLQLLVRSLRVAEVSTRAATTDTDGENPL